MDLRKDDVLVIWLDRLGLVGLVNTVQDLSARDVGRLPWRPHTSVDGTTVLRLLCVCRHVCGGSHESTSFRR